MEKIIRNGRDIDDKEDIFLLKPSYKSFIEICSIDQIWQLAYIPMIILLSIVNQN